MAVQPSLSISGGALPEGKTWTLVPSTMTDAAGQQVQLLRVTRGNHWLAKFLGVPCKRNGYPRWTSSFSDRHEGWRHVSACMNIQSFAHAGDVND